MGSNILSGDQLNFTRMGIVSVDEIKVVLADILRCEIKPEDLHKAINTCSELISGRHKLRTEQLKICCLSPPAIPDYNKCDVSLLYTLIRNTCPQLKPTQDWGKQPSITDLQIGDDIERLRVFRNEMFAHLDSSIVEDVVFTSQWHKLKQIFQRIQIFVNAKGLSVDYGKKLENIVKSDFGFEDMEKYKLWLEATMHLLKEKDANNGPLITIYGGDQILCGERMCFEAVYNRCSSSNNWPITWEKIQGNITEQLDTSKEKYRGSSSRCLVISHVLKEDEGEYRAVISRENNGSHIKIPSNSKQLTVMGEIPTLTMPKVVEVPLGSAAVFQPDIQAYPIPESVLWQRSKSRDPKSGEFETIDVTGPKYSGSTLDPKHSKLIINETTFEDSLFYQIVVENKVGKSCCSTFLSITGSPPNVIMNYDTNFLERSVTLICKVLCESSHQLTGLVWTKDNNEIDVLLSEGKYKGGGIENPSLKITNLNRFDAGIYQCCASNAVGSTQSEPMTLAVPNVKLIMRERDVENGALKLQASIKSIPDAYKVEWKSQMTPGDEFQPINVHEEAYKGTTISLPSPLLVVNRYNSENLETYKIEVSNFLGLTSVTSQDVLEENMFTEESAKEFVKGVNFAIYNCGGAKIRFNNLRVYLIKEISVSKLNLLKDSLKEIVPEGKLDKESLKRVDSVTEFVNFIISEGIFTERDVIIMQYLMRMIERPDLDQKCVEYATKRKERLCYFEEEKKTGRRTIVELHVDDDIEKFTKLDSLIETVAAIVDCDPQFIKVVEIRPKHSFIIVIEVEEKLAQLLSRKTPQELMKLAEFNIDTIYIGRDIISIAEPGCRFQSILICVPPPLCKAYDYRKKKTEESATPMTASWPYPAAGYDIEKLRRKQHELEALYKKEKLRKEAMQSVEGSITGYGKYEMQLLEKEKMESLLKEMERRREKIIRRKVFGRDQVQLNSLDVKYAVRHTASATTRLINASKNANKSNTNTSSEHQLTQQCQIMNEQLPLLIQGFHKSETNQDSATTQLQLIDARKEFIQHASRLVSAANAAAPTVGDQSAGINLNLAVKTMTTAMAELRSASGRAEEMFRSLDAALGQLDRLDKDLEEYHRAVDSGNLVPLPGETAELSASKLGSTSKNVGSAMAQLLTAASQGNENYVGVAARDTADALRVLTESTRGVAATSEDIEIKHQVIDSAHDVIDKSTRLLVETKRAMNDPENPKNQTRLNQVDKAVSSALNNCVNALSGQRDINNAIRQITSSSQELATTKYPSTDRTFQEVQIEINNAAVNLNQAANDIVTASRGTPKQLAESSRVYGSTYSEFIHSGLTMAGLSKDVDTQNQKVGGLKNISMVSSKLLLAAKSVSADPNAPNTKNLLSQAARALTESINQFINVCAVSAPGQKECDKALRQIQMMKPMLESANEPVTDMSYFECLDSVMEKSKVVQKPSQESKQTLVTLSRQVATSVKEVVHCAELIKGTDWVDPEDPTVIAESELLTAAKSIEAAAQKLSQLKPRKKAKEAGMSLNFEEQILEAAKAIASATAALVKSASAALRELVAQGKVRTRREIGAMYHKSQILDDDGQWSEGLISAAKLVAAATHSLCESANEMVQGYATEERLIASAKEVAGSMAHLLVACRFKADPNSVAMKRLQASGNAVKQATEVLVKAAQQAKQRDEDEEIDVAVDSRKVAGIKQELQFQEEMLRKEREWIEAREKLAKFRKQRYKDAPHDSDSSSAF